ncbi:DnaJ protein [Pycnococcus provasolii]
MSGNPSLFASLKAGGHLLEQMRAEHKARAREALAASAEELRKHRAAGGDHGSDAKAAFEARTKARATAADDVAAKLAARRDHLHPNAVAAQQAREDERQRRAGAAHARAMRRAAPYRHDGDGDANSAADGGIGADNIRFEEARPGRANAAARQGASRGVLVTLSVGYRGARAAANITLTADEHLTFTVGDLLSRVARETGVAALARGTLVLAPPPPPGISAGAAALRDPGAAGVVLTPLTAAAWSLGVRDNATLYLRPPVKVEGNSRPSTPLDAGVPRTPAERLRERHVTNTWRGALVAERDARWITSASDAELNRMLMQACAETREARTRRGVDGEDEAPPRNARRALEACAQEALPAWEGYRVLACSTASDILRVAPNTADPGVLKAAFRKASLLVHPDKNPSEPAAEAMRRVALAYKEMRTAVAGA